MRIADVARELGVRYVVEGSVRRGGNRVRITAKLIDALSGKHLWAQRYDRELQDVFAIQDDVTSCIVAVLPARIEAAATEAATRKNSQIAGGLRLFFAREILPSPAAASRRTRRPPLILIGQSNSIRVSRLPMPGRLVRSARRETDGLRDPPPERSEISQFVEAASPAG